MEVNKLLVIYVGVAGIRSEDIADYVNKISSKIAPTTFTGEIIVIPVNSYDTKIECVNPKYVTNEKLIEEHTKKMEILNKELKHQIELLNEKN